MTERSSQDRNQTPSSPAAMVEAEMPTSIVATSLPVSGSIRDRVSSGLIAHTAPAPTAIRGRPGLVLPAAPSVVSGSVTVRVIAAESGSTREMLAVKLR